jgi:hypothetical protein
LLALPAALASCGHDTHGLLAISVTKTAAAAARGCGHDGHTVGEGRARLAATSEKARA